MATPLGRVAARTLLSSSSQRTARLVPIQRTLASKPRLHCYSSLRRTPRSVTSSSRGGRIAPRTAPSRASPLAAAAAAPSSHGPSIPSSPPSTEESVVQGIDVAATPVIVPEDPFGVLQPYDTAAKVLSQPALIMTRQIEMMNVLVGFEQANKYAIVDPAGNPIGYIAEEDTTFVKAMSRQMLRTHRPFKASVLDLEGNEILKIHRPFAFINSRIMISTPDDRLIGEVQQEWHLIRRRYNLFTVEQPDPTEYDVVDTTATALTNEKAKGDAKSLNRVQFAHIDGGFLALDFDMQDEQGQKMASVNRNFVGFARELFTDSGQYALRFDAAVIQDLQQEQGLGATPTTPNSEKGLQQAQEIQANKDEKALAQLVDRGGLTLDQRAIMLACAVSIDFDYFSRHSGNGGIMPFPMMMGGGGPAPVPSSSSDSPVGTVIGAGAGAGAGQVLGGAAGAGAGEVAGGVGGFEGGVPPPAGQTMDWGDELPGGGPKNDWGEDVWAEDSSAGQDSGDSWFGGKGGDGDGEGGGFDWGDLL
ncbi:hypothetical protein BG006_006042 [Podila minutissima]|uniref:Scramblase-domain-containing protein n=1 Tax=Podila minutissima TaxID=64525 RepID=A0A9P5SWE2_9FUNG|nr:hypothetical protein BG006_006042 [Podila minutissima]